MALYRCGGGGINLLSPDVVYSAQMTATATTATIAVTKKPRYIIFTHNFSVARNMRIGIIDVENNKAHWGGYWDSANQNADWTNWQNWFTSITSSSVTYSRAGFGTNHTMGVFIYY